MADRALGRAGPCMTRGTWAQGAPDSRTRPSRWNGARAAIDAPKGACADHPFSRPAQCAFVMERGRKRRLSVCPICDMSSALANGDPMLNDWMKMTGHAMMLGLEAQQVICQRLMRIAAGGKGARFETERMVTEKIAAFGEAAATLAAGGSLTRFSGATARTSGRTIVV